MINAREAIILWDQEKREVVVQRHGTQPTAQQRNMPSSGGRAFSFWKDVSTEELYFRLLQAFNRLTTEYGIPPETVHEAFLVIPEYVASLHPCQEQDALEMSGVEYEEPTAFSRGYG